MSTDTSQICYILPEYDADTDTHFAYLYDLLEVINDEVDIFLIVEKASDDPEDLGATQTYVVGHDNYFRRLLRYIRLIWRAKRAGYHDIYVHYSFIGALASIFFTSGASGRVFYWNCGMPWLYERSWFRERIFRYILRNVILVTGTASLAKEYADRYRLEKGNTRVLHNWIDIDSFQEKLPPKEDARDVLDLPQDKEIILFIHRLSKRKGVDMIVPTLEELGSYAQMVVLGDGPELASLKQYAKNGERGDHLHVQGRVPHDEIHTYLAAADVFFMPSEEEGFPHVLLEAMAAGLPYVAVDVGGVGDISPDVQRSFILENRTPTNFARALSKIIREPPAAAQLTEHVRQYSFSNARKVFLNLFD